MIFDSYNESSTVSLDAIKESPYPLGYEGALMHVYENELNYYSLMKAVGLSEMKYYQETGGSLFVHEAGAFGSFIEKVKTFFKKVIEKIKSIFKKFIAAIDQYTLDNKKFVKKYGQEIMRKNLTDFEFEGYEFKTLNDASSKFTDNCEAVEKFITGLEGIHDKLEKGNSTLTYGTFAVFIGSASVPLKASMTSEEKTASYEMARGYLIGETGGKRLDSDDYRDRLQELFYGDGKDGDKETLDKINMREQLNYIDDSKKTIKEVEKKQKDITKHIENALKKLDKLPEEIRKYTKSDAGKAEIKANGLHQFYDATNGVDDKKVEDYVKVTNNGLDIARSIANDITVGFGVLVQAYKDRVTQAKAICVKALSYKHESAMVSESYSDYDSNDIFSSVNII